MIWFWILLGLAITILFLVALCARFLRRRLRGGAKKRIWKQFEHARSLPDPARRVVEADIVLDYALKELGYEGPLGEKLKEVGARFSNLDDVWKAHKFRNRIAHEPGITVSDKEAERVLSVLEKAIRELC